jgi:hypothetical protein
MIAREARLFSKYKSFFAVMALIYNLGMISIMMIIEVETTLEESPQSIKAVNSCKIINAEV